ncbi:PREDICTED: ribonuclease P protein subunit p29 [Cyprinodon variegatus]|uniref:ribonuclease P protein subunit p29 n=1 Tax=Cyprinodon variegatus TaxID=28743 RepID=UPI000742741B|nr:PREDICTED: ribonuclease P protein subunit p29 [Cyprinodon variegatus]
MEGEAQVYSPLPPGLEGRLGVEGHAVSRATRFTEAYLRNCVQRQTRLDVQKVLTHKALILDYSRPKKDRTRRSSKKAKGLNARQKRMMKVYQIRPEHQRSVRGTLCDGTCIGPTEGPSEPVCLFPVPLRHVFALTVVRSKCPAYVGITGILIQEFKQVFKIITKEDKTKVIPKRNSVFSVEIDGFVSHIYGNKLEMRASERSAKKFKVKGTIDL